MSHPRGRQPIGLDQPANGGSFYPFVNPSSDIQQLFADFFLAYEGLLEGQTEAYAYPFRIASCYISSGSGIFTWCFGFGSVPALPASSATFPPLSGIFTWCFGFGSVPAIPTTDPLAPPRNFELVVVDANDQVVLDSRDCLDFTLSRWDKRLRILEWKSATRVCRCVLHTDWKPADLEAGQYRNYANTLEPQNGTLVADTCYAVPPRLRSIKVANTVIEGKRIEFVEGYNVSLAEQGMNTFGLNTGLPVRSSEPIRTPHRVVVDATAGNGRGSFPGCGELQPAIRTINNQPGDSHQNFTLDANGCIRVQRPVLLTSTSPREFTYGQIGMTTAQATAALRISNDCRNCCDCEYFARTYQGIKRQWFLYREIAQSLALTRDIHAANRDRWLAEKETREADMLRIRTVMEGGAKVAWGLSLCNTSQCCLVGLKIYLTWVQYVDGEPVPPVILPYDCSQTSLDNSSNCDGPVPIAPVVYDANQQLHCYVVDYLDAQSTLSIYGRQCIADALTRPYGSAKLALHAMVEWDTTQEDSAAADVCAKTPLEADAIAEDVQTVWAESSFTLPDRIFAQKLTELKIVDPSDPYCRRCQCEE